ncbi:hypothetical protein RHO12_01935 [Orbus sturtevantii]|uniref:hypothetical protein n=1 Tax=Orbus sturtevantii TaxID=3074109 RepID=UPI00370D2D5B
MIKWFSNYHTLDTFPAVILKIYDNLIAKCTPTKDGLYSMGAMIAEVASLAISGVVWQTGVFYAHLKYQLMKAWVTFKSGTAPGVNIGGGFKLLSSAYPAQAKHLIKQLRESLNTAIKQLDGRFVDNLVDIDQFFKKTLNLSFNVFSEATTAKITRNQLHLRSARLAFLVGAFEVYNWHYIMAKKPSLFASDSDIAMEQLIATSSLVATTSDFVAYSIRAVRGKTTTSFAYAKVSFGVFSGLIGFFSGIKMAGGTIDHFKRGNYVAGTFGLLSSTAYLTSGGLNIMLGLSYRYEWVVTFFEKRAQNYIVSQGVQKAFNLFALRVVLFRFAGILGITALVIELLYDYFADNEIQVWLSYSALGIYKQEQKFTTSFSQAQAFEEIEMLKAVIEEKTNINLSELEKQAIEKLQQDHETILLQAENEALKWLL